MCTGLGMRLAYSSWLPVSIDTTLSNVVSLKGSSWLPAACPGTKGLQISTGARSPAESSQGTSVLWDRTWEANLSFAGSLDRFGVCIVELARTQVASPLWVVLQQSLWLEATASFIGASAKLLRYVYLPLEGTLYFGLGVLAVLWCMFW